jgi:hypothetical protein
LLQDGTLRAVAWLDRVTASELHAVASGRPEAAGSESAQRQALQTAGLLCAVAIVMTVTGEQVRFGVNLFTAELLLTAVAATRLVRALYQLM